MAAATLLAFTEDWDAQCGSLQVSLSTSAFHRAALSRHGESSNSRDVPLNSFSRIFFVDARVAWPAKFEYWEMPAVWFAKAVSGSGPARGVTLLPATLPS
jgi:hypothetical protein